MIPINLGTQFKAPRANSPSLWEVSQHRGSFYFECTTVGESTRVRQVFFGGEIQERISTGMERSADFFLQLRVGQVVHFHYLGGQFIRCTVVEHQGRIQLQKIALVGAWKPEHLQKHSPFRRSIEAGQIFRPHALALYENPAASDARRFVNPGTMPVL